MLFIASAISACVIPFSILSVLILCAITIFKHLREAEPSVRHLSPYSCRHTFATLSLSSGSDIRVVQELLGHSDIKTTSRYTHPDMDIMKSAVIGMKNSLKF